MADTCASRNHPLPDCIAVKSGGTGVANRELRCKECLRAVLRDEALGIYPLRDNVRYNCILDRSSTHETTSGGKPYNCSLQPGS